MKIETKQQLCQLLGEIVNATDMTVKELTQDTYSVQTATIQALSMLGTKSITIIEKYAVNLQLSFDEVYAMENTIQYKLQKGEKSQSLINKIDSFLLVLCHSFERNYNGQPKNKVISHYENMITKIKKDLK